MNTPGTEGGIKKIKNTRMIGGRFTRWYGSARPMSRLYAKYGYKAPRSRMYGRRDTVNAKATRALTLIRKFQKEEEVKEVDVTGTAAIAFASTDTWQAAGRILLNPLSQGTTNGTRIGSKVTLKDLTMRYNISRAFTDAGGMVARIVVFYDRKPAGAVPGATDIFETDNYLAPLNRGNAGRFAILFDKFYEFDAQQRNAVEKVYIKLNRTPKTDYGLGNAGDITDISKGALYVWANFGLQDTANSNFIYNSRVKYTDA